MPRRISYPLTQTQLEARKEYLESHLPGYHVPVRRLVGYEKSLASLAPHYYPARSDRIPFVRTDMTPEQERENEERVRVARGPIYSPSPEHLAEILRDVPVTLDIRNLRDIEGRHRVFYNQSTGEVQAITERTGDAHRFYALYYDYTPQIAEISGAAYKKLASQKMLMFSCNNVGIRWMPADNLIAWLDNASARAPFTEKPSCYTVTEQPVTFVPRSIYGHPSNLILSRVRYVFMRYSQVK